MRISDWSSDVCSSDLSVKDLLLETIAERKKNPGDDLISKALQNEVDGRKWTDREIFGHTFNLYIGGLDTVTTNLSLHFRHLADNPKDQQSMRSEEQKSELQSLMHISYAEFCLKKKKHRT